MERARRQDRGSAARAVGVATLVVFLLAMLVVVVGLTFSVHVSGTSMEPTLKQGDRLEALLFAKHDIHRFDVVEASVPDHGGDVAGGFPPGVVIVKRVIGMPGDQISIRGGARPVVLLKPAGGDAVFQVVNPTWDSQVGSKQASCCSATAQNLDPGTPAQWATVPANSYFLMGDNWDESTDSRDFGPVPASLVKAKMAFRIHPLSRFGSLKTDAHLVPRP